MPLLIVTVDPHVNEPLGIVTVQPEVTVLELMAFWTSAWLPSVVAILFVASSVKAPAGIGITQADRMTAAAKTERRPNGDLLTIVIPPNGFRTKWLDETPNRQQEAYPLRLNRSMSGTPIRWVCSTKFVAGITRLEQ